MSEEKSKTNGRRNRQVGHLLETQTVKRLHDIGYKGLCTSRNNSRLRDASKVDIMFIDEAKSGRFPYNIQCKNVSKSLDYGKILAEMPDNNAAVNVIFHKQTKKTEGGIFRERGQYAILKLDDFYGILKRQLELEDEVKAWSTLM